MKHSKKFREYFEDIKPVTDEELEELLNDSPRGEKRKSLKKAKKELYKEY
ncbi:MAG: hypothetical protein QXO16_08790 [Archaeoglobaceae archaeon]